MKSAGFTLVEVLISTALAGIMLAALYSLLSSGLTSFAKGTGKLEDIRKSRRVLEGISREVKKAVTDITVEESRPPKAAKKNHTLSFRVLVTDESGHPLPDPATGEPATSVVRFDFDSGKNILTRNQGGKTSTVATGIDDMNFTIIKYDIGEKSFIPGVMVEYYAEIEMEYTVFRSLAVPRVIAGWARDPAWVLNSLSNRLIFDFE